MCVTYRDILIVKVKPGGAVRSQLATASRFGSR